MNGEELAWMPAFELASLVRKRRISPVEIMEAVLQRIERLEPQVNAFAYIDHDLARSAARESEDELMAGHLRGNLHGVPVSIKDAAHLVGMPTGYGTRRQIPIMPTESAPLVERLLSAGAVPIGKTTVSELCWSGVSMSPRTGVTNNPWRHGYNAGASSAGAGAAAAAGFGPLHQGSDGAGSIRMPAHFCGVVGMKPTFGRVPYCPMPLVEPVAHAGPITRHVRDAALMLEVMAGPHPLDTTTLDSEPPPYASLLDTDLCGKRVAISPDFGELRVDQEVRRVFAEALPALESLGLELIEVTPPWVPEARELIRVFWPTNHLHLVPTLDEYRALMDPALVACAEAGTRLSVIELHMVRQRKNRLVETMHAWFRQFDYLITPSASVAAFPATLYRPEHWGRHEWDWIAWAEFLYPFNLSGNPAISVPGGFTADGLPVGLQIVGRRLDDLGVLQMAAGWERVRPWAGRRPPDLAAQSLA
ncbi:MAG: amidase [Bosea sp.]|uniref:amidase family protein n=1 Tax=Bosea sp. (in: a-proteobacteria) TaxID=1871050 RepID=UPI0010F5F704|nr:amidase [Bosea sp. (in: a-proteobacteria)]MCP4734870.1 amidase [Bosea sp. (in: a-proteobacteria)]